MTSTTAEAESALPDGGEELPGPVASSPPEAPGLRPGHPYPPEPAVRPPMAQPDAELDDPALYFNRELSWLDFNWRVLALVIDEGVPLLERVRFLSIVQSNLDEFFRKRVGGLKRQLAAGVELLSPDGRMPREQLELVGRAARAMQTEMDRCWSRVLRPALEDQGIRIATWDDVGPADAKRLGAYFRDAIYPILTPLAADPGLPFPFISNQSLSLAVEFWHPERDTLQLARVKVPVERGRFIPLSEPGHFLPLEELVARHVGAVFRGARLESAYPFRVTRNADIRRDEDEAEDLLQMISEELRERRFAPAVRLEVHPEIPESALARLRAELHLEPEDVYRVEVPLDFTGLDQLARIPRPELRYPHWEPVTPAILQAPEDGGNPGSIFTRIREEDILVHHPYESFRSSVQRFVEEAAADPRVLAIKSTLYRTSRDSPIVDALVRAAEAGKQVAVLVEVTARFDEMRNIEWGQMLERAGVHVRYGLAGLKTHAKVTLVVRDEEEGIRTYCHIGTGNYNSATAREYADLGLLSASRKLGDDVVNLFHFLTGHAPEQRYRTLVVAPRDMRTRFERRIAKEIAYAEAGRGGRVIAKMNAIDDPEMIRQLYRAARAGVSIDLIVRGHTRLRPGLPGVSENIRVQSIIGRFLEHDRVFWFGNGGKPKVYLGSADWRTRNLVERVEAVVPVRSREHRDRITAILDTALSDNASAWDLDAEGRWTRRFPTAGEKRVEFQVAMMEAALSGGERVGDASAEESGGV